MSTIGNRHVVAVIGGAVAGANITQQLAESGALVVVFEQNARPYGKIEDGLPRWHVALRRKEYEAINACLNHPNVMFVPKTRLGRDIRWSELQALGFSAIVLANGSWRDRPLPVENADKFLGKGFGYQNSFIYWFNHHHEANYQGPQFTVSDGGVVIGGGLASIDVVKALNFEMALQKLSARGITTDVEELDHDGLPKILERHNLRWEDLGLQGSILVYRRRLEDMPLTENAADPEKQQKMAEVRKRIVAKATEKYCFKVRPLLAPMELLADNDHVSGLRCRQMSEDAKPTDAFVTFKTSLVISSIGSIPQPIEEIPMRGELLDLSAFPGVFAVGNVVTGKGNIIASRRHSLEVAPQVIAYLAATPPVTDMQRILSFVTARQKVIGYQQFQDWIQQR
jgi:ferredoxin/flavodoxin---NADP+ reductase